MPGPAAHDRTPPDSAAARASTPPELLSALVTADATRPRLTWYDDAAGRTHGERIELSGRVLATWVAKAANLLVDDLGVERGDVVALELPVHWRAVYWALACWRVGAVVATTDPEPTATAAEVLVTDALEPRTVAPQVVSVSLPALARRWAGGPDGDATLPEGALDEAADLASHGDAFEPFDEPGPDDEALPGRSASALLDAARGRATTAGWTTGERVAVLCPPGERRLDELLVTLLAVWSVDGSAVLVRDADPARQPADDDRLAAERVTSACGPTGTPASRS